MDLVIAAALVLPRNENEQHKIEIMCFAVRWGNGAEAWVLYISCNENVVRLCNR